VLSLIAVRVAQQLELRRYGEAVSDASADLVAALAAGIALGAVFGWRRSRALGNDWQRGVIAVLGAVGALLIAFFFAIPAHHFFGLPGLIVLAALTAALGVAGSRWALRGSGP
jgi:peptidoglycan/LPS O-acetylase OafA/YrhL